MSITSSAMNSLRRVHFVGVGGIGMSALARAYLSAGKQVSGSDRAHTPLIAALESEGLTFCSSQVATNISEGIDLVVYTEAMPHDHEELIAARTLGIETINYFEALGRIANNYRLIAVAGSHGKTTTTAMLIDIFEQAGLDPSAVVGSLRASTKSNYRKGAGEYFIAEACEYRRDFLSLQPHVLVITNIELEHVDYYKTLDDVVAAFVELVMRMREGGTVVLPMIDPVMRPIIEAAQKRGLQLFDYTVQVETLPRLQMPGFHSRYNAGAALAASAACGVDIEIAHTALAAFRGTWRRFEYKGELGGAKVYDDYGHHPTEIEATIQGARELFPDRELVLVFQPHMYTRTATLFQDFIEALSKADVVYLLPIYGAREENTSGVSSEGLATQLQAHVSQVYVCETFADAEKLLRSRSEAGQIILVMGAGSITDLATALTHDSAAVS